MKPIPFSRRLLLFLGVVSFSASFALGIEGAKPLPQTCLLLKSGAVLEGRVTFAHDRYCVEDAQGKSWVHLSEAAMLCMDKTECFTRQQARIADEDASGHLRLADWCLRNNMPGFAKAELAYAKSIQPRHPKLRDIEVRIAHLAAAPRDDAAVRQTSTAVVERADPLAKVRQTFGPRAVDEFVERTQMQLVNHCGTSACHGGRQVSSFRLLGLPRGRRPSIRQSVANFESVLTVIDLENPEKSTLLTMALARHGSAATPPWPSADDPDYKLLREWVESLDKSESHASANEGERPALDQANVHSQEGKAPGEDRQSPQANGPAPQSATPSDVLPTLELEAASP